MNSSSAAVSGAARVSVFVSRLRLRAFVRAASSGLRRCGARLALVEPRWLVALGMLLLATGAALVGGLAQSSQAKLRASSAYVTHVIDVEERARALVSVVVGAENAVRSYVVSDRPEEAKPYRDALDSVPVALQRLRALTRENRVQQANLEQCEALINGCLEVFGRIIAVHDAGDRETAFALLLAGHVPRVMDAIRSSSSLLMLEEQRALAVRQQELAGAAAVGRASLVFVILVTGLFVAGVLIGAFQLSKLRQLARMCAWSRTVEYQGEWLSFEDYLSRRFHIDITHGISPAEAAKMRAATPTT